MEGASRWRDHRARSWQATTSVYAAFSIGSSSNTVTASTNRPDRGRAGARPGRATVAGSPELSRFNPLGTGWDSPRSVVPSEADGTGRLTIDADGKFAFRYGEREIVAEPLDLDGMSAADLRSLPLFSLHDQPELVLSAWSLDTSHRVRRHPQATMCDWR